MECGVWYIMTFLKLSGLSGIQAHIKAIKIIMEKFLIYESSIRIDHVFDDRFMSLTVQ